jgi:hypothetical protein
VLYTLLFGSILKLERLITAVIRLLGYFTKEEPTLEIGRLIL